MGADKQRLIQKEDYTRIVSELLYRIGAIKECPYCHIEYLTGKSEDMIYGYITNEFKKKFGEHGYDNALMKKVVKNFLSERFLGHVCDKKDD